VDAHRLVQRGIEIVDEDREAGDVVHVRVRNDDVPDFGPLFVCKSNRDASGIDRNTVVDQKAGQTLFLRCVTVSVKRTG
jgi:hypothetical protein